MLRRSFVIVIVVVVCGARARALVNNSSIYCIYILCCCNFFFLLSLFNLSSRLSRYERVGNTTAEAECNIKQQSPLVRQVYARTKLGFFTLLSLLAEHIPLVVQALRHGGRTCARAPEFADLTVTDVLLWLWSARADTRGCPCRWCRAPRTVVRSATTSRPAPPNSFSTLNSSRTTQRSRPLHTLSTTSPTDPSDTVPSEWSGEYILACLPITS